MPIFPEQIIGKHSLNTQVDFQAGCVLLIDKPLTWSSFDVVNKLRSKIRQSLGIKKIKVGHAGTLDPLATGLLILCTGKMTKDIDTLQAQDKTYSGHIMLGGTTPTYDAESNVDTQFPTDHIDDALISAATKTFCGQIPQVPPIYSAIKIKGKTAYDLARRGKEVEMPTRTVHIYSFDITETNMPQLTFMVRCGKGTYIRSLAHDFGKAMNSGAYLSSLRRDAIGSYHVDNALSIDAAIEFIEMQSSFSEDRLS